MTDVLKDAAIAESKIKGMSPPATPMAVNIQTVKEAGISQRAVDYIYNLIDPEQRKAVLADEAFKDTINAIRGTDSVPKNAIEITTSDQNAIAQIENGQGENLCSSRQSQFRPNSEYP